LLRFVRLQEIFYFLDLLDRILDVVAVIIIASTIGARRHRTDERYLNFWRLRNVIRRGKWDSASTLRGYSLNISHASLILFDYPLIAVVVRLRHTWEFLNRLRCL
jgi:ADP-heptose:LPS heptosyltransferase